MMAYRAATLAGLGTNFFFEMLRAFALIREPAVIDKILGYLRSKGRDADGPGQ